MPIGLLRESGLNIAQPLNNRHPLARGLQTFFVSAPPWAGGPWSGNGADRGFGRTGTLRNGATWRPSPMRGGLTAIRFDGTNDYIDYNTTMGRAGTGFAFSAFMRFMANGSFPTIASAYAYDSVSTTEWWFGANSTDLTQLATFVYDNTGASVVYLARSYSGSLTLRRWYHLTGTWDGSTAATGVKVYVNGVQLDDTDASSGAYASTNDSGTVFALGASFSTYPTTDLPLNGEIAAATFHTRDLAAHEVKALSQDAWQGFPGLLGRTRRLWYGDPAAVVASTTSHLPLLGVG